MTHSMLMTCGIIITTSHC